MDDQLNVRTGALKRPRSIKFSNKKQSETGIMSAILGVISLFSSVTALVFSYVRGSATPRSGIAVMLCMLFSLSGLILSLFSGKDQDKLQLFSRIGLVLNAAVLCLCGVILYYGVI